MEDGCGQLLHTGGHILWIHTGREVRGEGGREGRREGEREGGGREGEQSHMLTCSNFSPTVSSFAQFHPRQKLLQRQVGMERRRGADVLFVFLQVAVHSGRSAVSGSRPL